MTKIENTKLKLNTPVIVVDSVALVAGGKAVDYTNSDDGKILILLESTGAEEVCTIVKGNGLQGTDDLKVTVLASKTVAVTVESGKYVNAHGEHKGQLVIKGASKIKVIELP